MLSRTHLFGRETGNSKISKLSRDGTAGPKGRLSFPCLLTDLEASGQIKGSLFGKQETAD